MRTNDSTIRQSFSTLGLNGKRTREGRMQCGYVSVNKYCHVQHPRPLQELTP